MIAILSLLIITAISLLVVRVGSTALVMTGMSADSASFQAQSAFFGVGFTTREAEHVMDHPVRRRIIRHLMIAGNIGLTSVAASLVVSFVRVENLADGFYHLGIICAGLAGLWLVSLLPPVRAVIDATIRWSLARTGVAEPADYALLLRVRAGFGIAEIDLHAGHPLVGRKLKEIKLMERGVLVLGVTRADGSYVGTPTGSTMLEPGDQLTVYGKSADLRRAALAQAANNPPA